MTDVTDVLQLIDDAIEDYSVSGDAMRWQPDPPARMASSGFGLGIELVNRGNIAQAAARLFGVPAALCYRYSGPTMDEVLLWAHAHFTEMHRVTTVLSDMARQLQDAGVVPPPSPVDPMQRALEARRNRNTGPAARMRVPRRIDARRAR